MAKKKKTSTKKAKSSSKRPIASRIGFLSTIDCTRAMKDAFEAGSGVTARYRCGIGYKKLDDVIKAFNGDINIRLIVTAGGLIACQAADRWSRKPFVSLAGMIPSNPGDKFRGLVNLQMYTFNPDRIRHLDTKGFQLNQVYLFYNPNSATANDEIGEWRRGGAGPVVAGTTKDDNDPATYPSAFGSITDQTAAVVISADPFFFDTKDELVEAANRWVAAGTKRYVCYPLQNYKNARPAPIRKKATLYGPTLEQTYGYLGEFAADVLSEPSRPVTIMQVPLGDPVDL
jgi:hypothetical protein